jgi:hypothetical protein
VSKLGENSDLELNCWPSITPLGSVGKFADIPTFPRLAPHPATGPAVLRAPSCAMSGLRGGGPGLVGDGFALGDDALRPGDGSSGLEGGAFSLRGGTRCAGVGRMWRGGGAGDRSAATTGVPNAAIIAAATAPLIVLLSDNLAPGSATKKTGARKPTSRRAAWRPTQMHKPTTKWSCAASSDHRSGSPRTAFSTTGELTGPWPPLSRCPLPSSKAVLRPKTISHKILNSRA